MEPRLPENSILRRACKVAARESRESAKLPTPVSPSFSAVMTSRSEMLGCSYSPFLFSLPLDAEEPFPHLLTWVQIREGVEVMWSLWWSLGTCAV